MFRAPQRKIENTEGKPATKRQKLSLDDTNSNSNYEINRNAHLKGRRRFSADLVDLQEVAHAGFTLHGLKLQKALPGEDDGSVEVVIANDLSRPILSANLLVSDTSEYPSSHSLFCYSPDYDLSAKLQRIIDEIAEEPPRPLGETLFELMASVARVIGQAVAKPITPSSSDESDDGAEDYDAFDDYDDIGSLHVAADSIMSKLQQDFVDIVATEYRPGFIRIGGDDFVISVSLPVITLVDSIPPRALMAWDRRLLESSQHLTLLIGGFRSLYPVLEHDATYTSSAQRLGTSLTFKVGLSKKYKPGSEQVQDIVRKHGLILQDAEDELRIQAEIAAQKAKIYDFDLDEDDLMQDVAEEEPPEEEVIDPDGFDRFSLSNALESLMDQSFLKLVQLRRKFSLGWAGAELLNGEIERTQMKDDAVVSLMDGELRQTDINERKLGRTTTLPLDPLVGLGPTQPLNLPLTAFCYLIRRLSLCTRYCIVCHNKLHSDFEALKPYVCDSKLCSFQYYLMNRGPSLEYEILHNPKTVDLLVSLAYVSASEGVMEDPLPAGLGLRVPLPADVVALPKSRPTVGGAPPQYEERRAKVLTCGPDGLYEFDDLSLTQMRTCIAKLIHNLPSVEDMRKHLERKVNTGKYKPKLKDIDPSIPAAAWSILRWCVASCTAHIEAIESGEERIKGLDSSWTQFRLTVGAPDAEAKFHQALKDEAINDKNIVQYPVLYAFHGSPLRNWHSIIRHGLWYKVVANGRAYGDGVYLARDSTTSSSYYSTVSRSSWHKSALAPSNCMALVEVINQPAKFVSSNPHYVVKDTHWIMCRYLLVKGSSLEAEVVAVPDSKGKTRASEEVPFVRLDPNHQTAVGGKVIAIPDPAYQIESLISARKADYMHQEADETDMAIFNLDLGAAANKAATQSTHYDLDDENDYFVQPAAASTSREKARPMDDWVSNTEHVMTVVGNLAFPPLQSSPSASMAIQRELKVMLKEQETASSLRELGWYMPPELIGDNLYQWIIELHSLDKDLPLTKDMEAHKLNSIIFEIRFPPTFPNSPPFFRIVTPRFLPFIQGGGGHVTGGGSICMDLLTSNGWLPSYSISAVMMQIRLALSNLEPRPGRLSSDWNRPYGVDESLAGYKRAAATHHWTLPEGLDKLVR